MEEAGHVRSGVERCEIFASGRAQRSISSRRSIAPAASAPDVEQVDARGPVTGSFQASGER